MKIYHVRGTRSVRPIWLCYELDLPVEIQPIDFSASYRDSPEWRAISPAGKVPALRDGELTMFESGAMIEYILERYGEGRLQPESGTPERAIHSQWCWFAESTLARPLGLFTLLRHSEGSGPSPSADARHKVDTCLETVDRAVAGRAYLLGDNFTAADIMLGYTLWLVARLGLLETWAHAHAYLQRLEGRDAMQRALKA